MTHSTVASSTPLNVPNHTNHVNHQQLHSNVNPNPNPRVTPGSPDEELRQFTALHSEKLIPGNAYYVIDYKWFTTWCEYTGYTGHLIGGNVKEVNNSMNSTPLAENGALHMEDDSSTSQLTNGDLNKSRHQPSQFDNTLLLSHVSPPILKQGLTENIDYYILNEAAYFLLEAWYSGGPTIKRSAVTRGMQKQTIVDLFPTFLGITFLLPNGTLFPIEHPDHFLPFSDYKELREIPLSFIPKIKELLTSSTSNSNMESTPNRSTTHNANQNGTDPLKLVGRLWKKHNTQNSIPSTEIPNSSDPTVTPNATPRTVNGDNEIVSPTVVDGWELISHSYDEATVENMEWKDFLELLVEFKYDRANEKWVQYLQQIVTYEPLDPATKLDKLNGNAAEVAIVPTVRLWSDFRKDDIIDARDSKHTWYEARILSLDSQKMLVHFINWASKWDETIMFKADRPIERWAPRSSYTTGAHVRKIPSSVPDNTNHRTSSRTDGVVGLRNLGNTCFMNSILQCLAQTPLLSEYFLNRKHLKQLNRENPLGWHGKVAEVYGELLHAMWRGGYSPVVPRAFKQVISDFQPRFHGYQQQDSSELLSFLLDGLHEDLNLVRNKPLTSPIDNQNKSDLDLAAESWQLHLKRNRSVIVDLFSGQLKSRVVCPNPTCCYQSITFDPYTMISVPVPPLYSFLFTFLFVPSPHTIQQVVDGNPEHNLISPVYLTVKLPKPSTIQDIKNAVALLFPNYHFQTQQLVMFAPEDRKLLDRKILKDDFPVKPEQDRKYVLLDVPELLRPKPIANLNPSAPPAPEKSLLFALAHFHSKTGDRKRTEGIGVPSIVSFPDKDSRTLTFTRLHAEIREKTTVFVPELKSYPVNAEMEVQQWPYEVILLDKEGRNCHMDLSDPKHHPSDTIDLQSLLNKHGGIMFGCIWRASEPNAAILPSDKFNVHPLTAASTLPAAKSVLDLSDCFDAFVKEEILRQSEAWYCSKCKVHQCAYKKFDLWSVPDVLVVHLKRFTPSRFGRFDKIDSFVNFPVRDLDMSSWIVDEEEKQNALYDLFAVSNHYGSLGGGHYTAYAKNLIDQKWYTLDDSDTSLVQNELDVRTSAAYVLFYRRKNMRMTSETLVPK